MDKLLNILDNKREIFMTPLNDKNEFRILVVKDEDKISLPIKEITGNEKFYCRSLFKTNQDLPLNK